MSAKMSDRDRDSLSSGIQRRAKSFTCGFELGAVDVAETDEWTEIRVTTSRYGHQYQSTTWHYGGYKEAWAIEIARIHLIGHYEKENAR